jgi:hypothetical protein
MPCRSFWLFGPKQPGERCTMMRAPALNCQVYQQRQHLIVGQTQRFTINSQLCRPQ